MIWLSFETLSFLSHLVHWKAYAIVFWQMWKDILGFELRSPRIVCTKLIPSAKKYIFITNWIEVYDQTFTNDCVSIICESFVANRID